MSFPIKLQRSASEKNRVIKDLTDVQTSTGELRAECSLIDPVILMAGDIADLKDVNYMTITSFGRSYFITGIRSIRTGVIEISGHVDVLSTYAEQLLENKAIIAKSENDWNLYLNDGSLKTYQDSEIYTHTFPAGFGQQTLVLSIAGGASEVPTIVITSQPQDTTVRDNANAYFTVAATSPDYLTYQWLVRTTLAGAWRAATDSGSLSPEITVTGTSTKDGYQYRCLIMDTLGNSVLSRIATLHSIA